jgi:hypothetical protein
MLLALLISENTRKFSSRKLCRYVQDQHRVKEPQLIFHLKKLRDIWAAESSKHGGLVRIDVLAWLNKMTLDVIGLSGTCIDRILFAFSDDV